MKRRSRFVRFGAIASAMACACAFRIAGANHYILDCEERCPGAPTEIGIGEPGAVTADAWGNVYFVSQNVVFKLAADGYLVRVAGNGSPGYSGDGGPAVDALLNIPGDYPEMNPINGDNPLVGALATDRRGSLYIADTYNNRIRSVDAQGTIRTVAGGGDPGFGWSDFRFAWPAGVGVDASGNLYVSSLWGWVTQTAVDGAVAVLARWSIGDPYAPVGVYVPQQLALDSDGSVFVGDALYRVVKVTPAGEVVHALGVPIVCTSSRPCAWTGGGTPATETALSYLPSSVAVDAAGNLYVADTGHDCIRRLDAGGVVSTVAGNCVVLDRAGFSGDGGPATAARLFAPKGIAVDAAGNLYIADTANRRIRKVGTDGIIRTIAGSGEPLLLR